MLDSLKFSSKEPLYKPIFYILKHVYILLQVTETRSKGLVIGTSAV